MADANFYDDTSLSAEEKTDAKGSSRRREFVLQILLYSACLAMFVLSVGGHYLDSNPNNAIGYIIFIYKSILLTLVVFFLTHKDFWGKWYYRLFRA